MKRPNSMRHLDDAIRRLCGGAPQDFVRARTVMANAIVASMLPDGVVKGGSALKMRFGEENTRFTTDLDTADGDRSRSPTPPSSTRGSAPAGKGFSGRVVEKDPASPDGVPEQYVMQPYDVKLDAPGKPWCTVPLEVGHNEIGDADAADWAELTDAGGLFEAMGFPAPGRAPLMPLDHQVAQKLHAVSGPGRSGPRSHRPPADRRQSRGRPCGCEGRLPEAFLLQAGAGLAAGYCQAKGMGRDVLRRPRRGPARAPGC